MMHATPRRGSRTGYTMFEMVIALSLLAGIVGSIATLGVMGSKAYGASGMSSSMAVKGRRVLSDITEVLALADADDFDGMAETPMWDEDLAFDCVRNVDPNDGSVDWSGTQIRFEYAPEEAADDVDNDGDGLVDECIVVLVTDVGEADQRELVLERSVSEYLEGEEPNGVDDNGNGLVDERGLCFERSGSMLTIHLTLQRTDVDGRIVLETMQTGVRLRN